MFFSKDFELHVKVQDNSWLEKECYPTLEIPTSFYSPVKVIHSKSEVRTLEGKNIFSLP